MGLESRRSSLLQPELCGSEKELKPRTGPPGGTRCCAKASPPSDGSFGKGESKNPDVSELKEGLLLEFYLLDQRA